MKMTSPLNMARSVTKISRKRTSSTLKKKAQADDRAHRDHGPHHTRQTGAHGIEPQAAGLDHVVIGPECIGVEDFLALDRRLEHGQHALKALWIALGWHAISWA
jgi:hypothetical protein